MKICVFAGSSMGSPVYQAAAKSLGQAIAENKHDLIYGGGNIGLMGILSQTALAFGGHVTGVSTQHIMEWESSDPSLPTVKEERKVDSLIVVDSMNKRKQVMIDMADAFIALPGGLGTLDEAFEAITLTQLGLHAKPCAFLSVDNYYDLLGVFLLSSANIGFINSTALNNIFFDSNIGKLLEWIEKHKVKITHKWLDK